MNKDLNAYKTIGEVAKILSLNSKNSTAVSTATIRFWEKKFKQIKPKIFNGNRRYYDPKNIELLKKVQYLLKEQGMTINGTQKLLNSRDPLKLDETSNQSIKAYNFKNKLIKISNILLNLNSILTISAYK